MRSSQTDNDSLSKNYTHAEIEKKWRAIWKKRRYSRANVNTTKKTFCMVIPPPNITGILHMGHALNNTLQDIVARYKRMCGYEVLWMPGTDHAGIATQNVVEKSLRNEGQNPQELGRDKFLEHVWSWREKYGHTILEQLKRMGCSCDWDRVRFTMDEGLSHAVREVFVRLYKKGLIYKGYYIINWCPRCRTALSEEEVTHKEILGHLYTMRYPIEGSDETLLIATTRPETMLGDTAVGFHPDDKRYRHLKGKTALLPILQRRLKIVQDRRISPEFGTGALKITPSHDPVDFELGKKHGLDFINIMNPDGTLNEAAGPYAGMDRFRARTELVRDLEQKNIITEIKEHRHSVGHCYRCETIVEPRCSDQWFVRMKPLAGPALHAAKKKQVVFHPERWLKVYTNWLENIRDWCISRQIWWGHRIPVWTCRPCLSKGKTKEALIVSVETPAKCSHCGSQDLAQEQDVLDTWFSSWLWPFTTLGWPDKTPDLKRFYPTQTLVTGYEIIFFWVARMIMAGYEFTGKPPFKDIYIHGIVRDAEGVKMSKSLGNSVDPVEIIDEFGADALRFSIVSITSEGQDVFASKERLEIGRNFANKIWNACRFTLANQAPKTSQEPPAKNSFTAADLWILSRLSALVVNVTRSLDAYRFNDVTTQVYEFFWHEFCDWYLEIVKPRVQSEACQWVLAEVWNKTLAILHPVMPFLTEELWEKIYGKEGKETLMVHPWPKPERKWCNAKIESEMGLLIQQVQSIRNIRSAWRINPNEPLTIAVKTSGARALKIFNKYSDDIRHLARIGSLEAGPKVERPVQSVIATVGRIETYVVLKDLVDIQKERGRLETALGEVNRFLDGLNKKLQNNNFLDKAPKDVVQKEKNRYKELVDQKQRIENNLEAIAS